MVKLVPTLLAAVAVALFVTGLVAMTIDDLTMAGMSFLSASIVLYLRETRTGD